MTEESGYLDTIRRKLNIKTQAERAEELAREAAVQNIASLIKEVGVYPEPKEDGLWHAVGKFTRTDTSVEWWKDRYKDTVIEIRLTNHNALGNVVVPSTFFVVGETSEKSKYPTLYCSQPTLTNPDFIMDNVSANMKVLNYGESSLAEARDVFTPHDDHVLTTEIYVWVKGPAEKSRGDRHRVEHFRSKKPVLGIPAPAK